jgi:hypothetical protein
LILGYNDVTIKLPSTPAEWNEIQEGFEEIGGIPNVCGAIDGSLVLVKRYQLIILLIS